MEASTPSGMLLVDKPLGWTSFEVVNKFKFFFRRKYGQPVKIGHAGTLDPLATGLLILCYGKMTREISGFQDMEKSYTGSIQLGASTPSYDLETEIDQIFPTDHLNAGLIKQAASGMTGRVMQRPPAFSAKKIDGKRAYKIARAGKMPEVRENEISIHEFEIISVHNLVAEFKIRCSKGTYIRSIAHDFGSILKTGGYLKSLRRVKIGPYKVEDAFSPEDISTRFDRNEF